MYLALTIMYFTLRAVVTAIPAAKEQYAKAAADGLTHKEMAAVAVAFTTLINALAMALVLWLDHYVALVIYVLLDIYAVVSRK